MPAAVRETYADLMSQDGLRVVVRFSAQDFVIWKLSADFIAVIGTPVPAVIGTDYRALSRMIEKKTGIPALTIDTDGTKLYDDGEKKTWKELF